MRWSIERSVVGALAMMAGVPAVAGEIEQALAKVNAQCPEAYPEVVTALPEEREFAVKDTPELMKMLGDWNPALRAEASRELGRRGETVMPVLRKAIQSGQATVRAGASQAMAAILKESDKEHPELADAFIRLAKDPELAVRVSALQALSRMTSPPPEATRAVLELCNDEDAYLAQDAMITLEKSFSVEALEHGEVVAALKEAMKSSLPRGKGHVLRLVGRMGEETRREFVPVLLAHLDWQPMRDTMFGAGGQQEAVEMLTRMKVPELVPRLPGLMSKSMRGPGLFDPCIQSLRVYGKDAKPAVPELRRMIEAYEVDPKQAAAWAGGDGAKRVETLRQTVAFLESL